MTAVSVAELALAAARLLSVPKPDVDVVMLSFDAPAETYVAVPVGTPAVFHVNVMLEPLAATVKPRLL